MFESGTAWVVILFAVLCLILDRIAPSLPAFPVDVRGGHNARNRHQSVGGSGSGCALHG